MRKLGHRLGFIDAPGHEKFVHNMLAGATGIDFVLMVIAADDGIMPQTREHLAIVDLLGIERGIVALTKTDLAPPPLSADVISESRALLLYMEAHHFTFLGYRDHLIEQRAGSLDGFRAYALPVLRHRVLCNFAAASEGVDSDEIVRRLLAAVPEPDYAAGE